ncbi:MAG: hypothetical protein F6J86_12555 [Symploca sp. SIO1B1]|nr:hypothetical protein [Symploca sp. SIO1B1]
MNVSTANPYLEEIFQVLPRILALYDTNPVSPTYGLGDRYRWAWKLIDFGNGTFQGAAHGLAWLLKHHLLPTKFDQSAILRRIDAMFQGAKTLCYPNGSLEEAFPFESSFCVTALVAYDLLSAIKLLRNDLNQEQQTYYLDIIRPMIQFLHHAEETHAFISNHLATAAAALYKWSSLTNEPGEARGQQILERILAEQSPEGWFREYEGADPGYQTLCTYYLADLHYLRPDLGLLKPLQHSLQFLWHFAHPDGSFGGYYGSRNTRFYYPAGIEALAGEIPEAAVLAQFMRNSIEHQTTVTLSAIDEPNLMPMFNAYCWAAVTIEQDSNLLSSNLPSLPALSKEVWRSQFSDAGLLLDKGSEHYTLISWHKGGVCYHFPLDGKPPMINTGVVIKNNKEQYFSSQAYQNQNSIELDNNTVTILAPLLAMHRQLPSPLQFVLLRLLNITLMRNLLLGSWVKKLLVKFLITGKQGISVRNCRQIDLGLNLALQDSLEGNTQGITPLEIQHPFSAIHMASQGYWQLQDDAV